MFASIIASVALAFTAPSGSQDISQEISAKREQAPLAGRWTGVMGLGDTQHPINLWFDPDERAGRFQIIGLTSDRNPIQSVIRRGDVVTFTLPSSPVHEFRGTINGARLTGTVRIGGSSNRFSVQRVG
ncbi:hypothetical protein [Brevundimonas diminuta]